MAPNAIAEKLAKNSKKAPAAASGSPRANRMPHVVIGGTNAVAMATPTMTLLKLGDRNVNPPARPPTKAIKRSRVEEAGSSPVQNLAADYEVVRRDADQ